MIIYKITNKINNKLYIGKTAQTIEERFSRHTRNAKANANCCKYIEASIRKYGADNFSIEIIDTCGSSEEANLKEIYWINYYNSCKEGMNLTLGGDSMPGEFNGNAKLTYEKVNDIIQLFLTGNYKTKDLAEKYNISISTINKILTFKLWAEVSCKLSIENKSKIKQLRDSYKRETYIKPAKIMPEWIKRKISAAHKGKPMNLSLEAKEHIRQAHSKLNREDVENIREMYASGSYTQKELSLKYNVRQQTISRIINHKRWA